MKSLGRDKWSDLPALVIYSMVGNDVCNEKMDTVAHMTSPGDFYKNVMKTLRFLEKALPPNSHIVLVGLIDGSILYKAMAKRYHPLGELRKDLTFDDVYQWFNCMEIGPCHGWMSSNATLRKMTTRHARKLSQVLQAIAQQERFITFDVHYVPNPFQNVIDEWKAQGREVWELIEPVDSLHPTQKAQPLIAESLWTYLETYMPFVLGPINERNDQIKALFGQQGGH
jgi:acyloxyacyl hydrolase